MKVKSQTIPALLAIALVLQCVALLKITFVDGTAIGTTMFMTFQWAEKTMLSVDRGVAALCLTCAVLLLGTLAIRKNTPPIHATRVGLAGFVTCWFVLIALATWYQGGSFGAPYAPLAYAARYGLPVVLVMALAGHARAEQVARWLIAITFFIHGMEAWSLHPRFVDYLIVGFAKLLSIKISESGAEWVLRAIAVIDCVSAVLIVLKRWRAVALWMAFWGAATAASRMIHLGFFRWPATLFRAAHVALPLALYLWWRFDKVPDESNKVVDDD